MTYEEVTEQILNARRFDGLPGVFVTEKILEVLGMPQAGIKWIHVAGTNGKGSVSAFLCRILQEAGYRAGMFTSPHLMDFRERIRIGGELIPKETVTKLGERLLRMDFGVEPKMFDYCLAMAMLYFREQKCDVAVMETGLGGRLDSTNALGVPAVSVITRIGYDHMEILGDTLERIAAEKAGILKAGTILVSLEQKEEAARVIALAAEEAGVADIRIAGANEIKKEGCADGMQEFSFRDYTHVKLRMMGVHQYENAALAILAAEAFLETEALSGEQKALQKEWIVRGLSQTTWDGRLQILQKKPFLLVDGAHNADGAAALRESLAYLFPEEKFHFIMGVMADKDYEEMAGLLAPLALDFHTVTVDASRALEGEELAACIRKRGVLAVASEKLSDCLDNLSEQEKTVAFGSLYFIGEVQSYFRKKLQKNYKNDRL